MEWRAMSVLFYEQKLSDYFDDVNSNITREIDNLPENQILSLPEDELINHVVSKYEIIPLEIYQDSMSAKHEDISLQYKSDSRYCDGINFRIQLPFNGDYALWYKRPSRCTVSFPEGSVQTNKEGAKVLTFDLAVALDQSPDTHNKLMKGQIESIKPFIEQQKKDIEQFNKTIESTVKTALNIRKKKLEKKEQYNKDIYYSIGKVVQCS